MDINVIGSIASLGGLFITILTFRKVREVKFILKDKAINKEIIIKIEAIMKFREDIPLKEEEIRSIKYISDYLKKSFSFFLV